MRVVGGCFFFFKQKTAYEITYGDWSSDVCSSDLACDRKAFSRRSNTLRASRMRCRSEEHTSELQSPYVISYAVFCLKKNTHLEVVARPHRPAGVRPPGSERSCT